MIDDLSGGPAARARPPAAVALWATSEGCVCDVEHASAGTARDDDRPPGALLYLEAFELVAWMDMGRPRRPLRTDSRFRHPTYHMIVSQRGERPP